MRTITAAIMAAVVMAPALKASAAPTRRSSEGRIAHRAFPYLRWPVDLAPKQTPVAAKLGHFRFWDGTALQDVEGRSYITTLVSGHSGGQLDDRVFRQAMEKELTRMGAVRIASGHVPAAAIATINDADRKSLASGLGDVANDSVDTWTLRRPHRQVWFQYSAHSGQASVAVVEADLA